MRSLDIIVLLVALSCVIILLNMQSAVTLRKRFTIDFHGSDAIPHLAPLVLPSFPSYMEKSSTPHRHLLYVTKGRTLTMHSLKALSHDQKWYVGGQGEIKIDEKSIVMKYVLPDKYDLIQAVHYVPETIQFIILTRSWKVLCFNYTEPEGKSKKEPGSMTLIFETDLLERNPNDDRPKSTKKPIQRILASKIITSTFQLGIHKGDQGIVVLAIETEHHHYHYYALHMIDGVQRWSHEPEDYHFRPKSPHALFFHHAFDETHHGEMNWRVFESDILRQFPHRYRHAHDLSLSLDHFHPQKAKKKRKRSRKKRSRRKSLREEFGKQKTTEEESSTPSKEEEKPKTEEVDPKTNPNEPLSITDYDWYRNVIVIHHQKGIEVLHLYTGRTITTFGPLNHDVLYDDVNSDGIMEGAQVSLVEKGDGQGQDCHPFIQTGIPSGAERIHFDDHDDEAGFSLCHTMTPIRSFLSLDFVRHQYDMKKFYHNIPPTIIPPEDDNNSGAFLKYKKKSEVTKVVDVSQENKKDKAKKDQEEEEGSKQIIFYTNNGMVTSVSVESTEYLTKNWQVMVPTHFQHPEHHFYEVRAFQVFEEGGRPDHILVSGQESMTIMDKRGYVLDTLNLDVSPHAPLVFSDLTGNGRNDILLIHMEKIVGIVTHVSYSRNSSLTFFLFGFVMFIIAMYISTFVPVNNPLYYQKKK